MSSILEALKKLEDEKTARRSGTANLTGKVAGTGRRPRKVPAWLIPSGMLAVALISVLATYTAMNGFSWHRGDATAAKREPGLSPTPDSSRQQAAGSVTGTQSLPESGSVPLQSPGVTSATRSGAARGKGSRPPESASNPDSRQSPAPEANPPEGKKSDFPVMTVTGIAWQKDSAFRMAVVNGVPVREGGDVEGARVKEILPDRVGFSYNGKDFEVSLEK